jgi:hypothetical protein
MRIFLLLPTLLFGVSHEYAFQAVDPILPLPQFQFETDFSPINRDPHGLSNIGYFKALFPIPTRPLTQGIRIEVPLTTTPTMTNLGDIQFLDLFLWEGKWGEAGIGPIAILPTALKKATGQGKWQLGPALGFLLLFSHTQIGLLAQNPISFAGPSNRPDQNYLLFQPIFFHHLGKGWYLQSNPQWTFDWLHHTQKIPLNFGAGRVFTANGQPLNVSLRFEGMAFDNAPGYVPEFTIQFLFTILLTGKTAPKGP